MKKQIPNLFTLLNLVFGCIAIVYILQSGLVLRYSAEGEQFVDIPEKIWYASLFIFLAAVVDFLDGFVARLLGASSEMGKQLDSLADIVSFGVAPSLIIYQFLRLSFAAAEDGLNISLIWLCPAFLLAAAGAYRLARYNIITEKVPGFLGLPIPAAGLFVGSIPLIYWNSSNTLLVDLLLNKWFLYALIIILSGLMVSRIPMMDMKFIRKNMKQNLPRFILMGIAVLSIILLQWLAAPVIFLAYLILSFIFKNNTDVTFNTGENNAT